MGLAAAKNKRRLGNDPNNTRWSRNTDTFGHKMLRAHGWEPGQFLGAQGSAHAHLHTDASMSHIRVVLKEDNLGLGAKRNNGDECVGLDAFQHLLGRLNGKSEEVLEQERVVREGVKLTLYADRKWGPMRFVYGGLLVGDEMQEEPEAKEAIIRTKAPQVAEAKEPAVIEEEEQTKKSKKRKADDRSESKESKKDKKDKKSKRRKTEEQDSTESDDAAKKAKKAEKKLRKANKEEADKDKENTSDTTDSERKRKREKKEKKEKKKEKKDKKSKSGEEAASDSETKPRKKSKSKTTDDETTDSKDVTPAASTPAGSGYSTPEGGVPSRHLSRRRFIAQKRLAFADPKALSQIFMIKS